MMTQPYVFESTTFNHYHMARRRSVKMVKFASFVCLMMCVFCGRLAHSQSIKTPQTDAANLGVISTLNLETRPRRIQRFDKSGGSIGEATVIDGVIFAVKLSEELHALRVSDGKLLWKTDLGSVISGLVPSKFGGQAKSEEQDWLLVSHYNGMAAVDRETGRVVWNQSIPLGLAGPVVVGKQVFAAGYDGHAYCLEVADGSVVWRHDYLFDAPEDPKGFDGDRARVGNRPARPGMASSDSDTMYFCVFDQCRIIAVDCQTGKRRWDYQTRGWMYMRPTVSPKYVFVGSQDKHFYCLNKADGKLKWKFPTKSRIEASGAISNGRVYFGSCDANLYCVQADTGELIWKQATEKRKKYGGPIYEQPVVSGQTIYLPTMEGQVYAFDAQSGQILWQLRPSRKSEIDGSFSDGKRLYVTTRLNFDDEGEDALYVLGE